MNKNKGFILSGRVIRSCLALLVIASLMSVKVGASSFSQGYHSTEKLVIGAVVSTVKDDGTSVENTTLENEDLMVGVVSGSTGAIIDLQPKGSDLRVGVSGQVQILVTDFNGDIKTGDYLVVSPIAGITMKDSAASTSKKYVAIAKQDFQSTAPGVKQIKVDTGTGTTKQANVGLLQAQLLLQDKPAQKNNASQNAFLSIASKLAGKKVSIGQLLAATAVFVTTFSVTGLLLNSSIKGSFVSLGRNPLSRPAIVGSLIKVLSFCALILIAGLTISYAILLI